MQIGAVFVKQLAEFGAFCHSFCSIVGRSRYQAAIVGTTVVVNAFPPGPRLPSIVQAVRVTVSPYRLDGAPPRALRERVLVALPDLRAGRVRGRPGAREGGVRGRPHGLPRRRGQHAGARRRPRRAFAAHARRGAPPEPAQAPAAALPRRARAPLRGGDGRGHRGGGGELAGGLAARAATPDAGDHARGDPASGVRRPRRAAHGPVPGTDPAARGHHQRARLAAVHGPRPRRPQPGRALPACARRGRRAALCRDRRAAGERRRGRARRRALAPPARAARGREPDERRRASRRADDTAHGGSRDHRNRTLLGVRAAAADAAGARAGDGVARRRRLPRRSRQGDAARAPGDRRRRAQAHPRRHAARLHPAGGHARAPRDRRHSRPTGPVSAAGGVPARALPRRQGRGVHLDPLRRRACDAASGRPSRRWR